MMKFRSFVAATALVAAIALIPLLNQVAGAHELMGVTQSYFATD